MSPKKTIECAIQFSAKNMNTTPANQPSQKARLTVAPRAIASSSGARAIQARKVKLKLGNDRMSNKAVASANKDCPSKLSGVSFCTAFLSGNIVDILHKRPMRRSSNGKVKPYDLTNDSPFDYFD